MHSFMKLPSPTPNVFRYKCQILFSDNTHQDRVDISLGLLFHRIFLYQGMSIKFFRTRSIPPSQYSTLYARTHAKGNCKIIEIIAFSDDVLNIPVH